MGDNFERSEINLYISSGAACEYGKGLILLHGVNGHFEKKKKKEKKKRTSISPLTFVQTLYLYP